MVKNAQPPHKREPTPTKLILQTQVIEYISRCIECQKCMDVCPVFRKLFSMRELNRASEEGTMVPSSIREFAFHCMQCGKCVPVCPKDIHRDQMMLWIKHKLRNKKPWGYTRYLLIKGPKAGLKRIIQRLYIVSQKLVHHDLAYYMETIPIQKTEVLFYPGCYLYSTRTVRQTCRLLDYIGCSYSVLGGVTICCGAPHRLQGELDQADNCQALLYEKIKTCNPKIILTACAECFEALEQIKQTYQMEFEVFSIIQYLVRYREKFQEKKIKGKVTVHDSCRFPGESPQGTAAYEAVSRFAERVDSPKDHLSSCCSQWNHDSDPMNASRQKEYLNAVEKNAQTLACNCLTCYEELRKTYTNVEIIDVLQLFEESLEATETKEDTA